MRILAATDGSDLAGIGCELARDLATLSHGQVRIVAVLPPVTELLGGAWPAAAMIDPEPVERAARERLEDRLRRELERTPADLRPTASLLRGRPAAEIVAEAMRWDADVIVVGSRGHGTMASVLIGSVSEEVIDRSPIPVLVARTPRMRRFIVAADGSPASQAAVDMLATGDTFQGLEAWVVDVAPTAYPWWLGVGVADGDSFRQLLEMNEQARRMEQTAAEAASQTLRDVGLKANSRHCIGDAAAELVRAAAEVDADTVVIGSRGQTGLRRLVLGSVARQVLRHAPASVLVVHPKPPVEAATRPGTPEAAVVGAPRTS
jgi:nucleotide-binding universal stress UspA family protein